MIARPLKDRDLPEIAEWFEDVPWNLPFVECGAKTYGFVAEDEYGLVAVAHLYLTDTGYAFIDWSGSNPDRLASEARQGLEVVLTALEAACRHIRPQVSCLVLYTRSEAMAQVLKDGGWRSKRSYIQCTKMVGDD